MGIGKISLVVLSSEHMVLLIHSHFDHMGGASSFQQVAIIDDQHKLARLRQGRTADELIEVYNSQEIGIEVPLFCTENLRLPVLIVLKFSKMVQK